MSHTPAQVVVVGSFNVDHVWTLPQLPCAGETRAGEYRSGPGGKGFNQAVAAARAGAATAFVCALGDDAGGDLARTLATADAIDLRAQACDAPTGTAGIYVDVEGRNSIVFGPGANAALSAAFVTDQGSLIAGAGIVVAQMESPAATVQAAFSLAREAGVATLLNPAPADARIPDGLWALADLATPNETEFCAQLQRRTGEHVEAAGVAALDDATLHAHCRRLLPHGSVIVTLGAAGCFVSHPDTNLRGDLRPCYRVAAPAVQARDTTGAGDAFNGALAAALAAADEQPFIDHVRYASRYAALSTERPGAAAAMPRDGEVRARFPS